MQHRGWDLVEAVNCWCCQQGGSPSQHICLSAEQNMQIWPIQHASQRVSQLFSGKFVIQILLALGRSPTPHAAIWVSSQVIRVKPECLRQSLPKSILLCKARITEWKCTSFLDTRSWQEAHIFLFTVITSVSCTSFTVNKNEPHSSLANAFPHYNLS